MNPCPEMRWRDGHRFQIGQRGFWAYSLESSKILGLVLDGLGGVLAWRFGIGAMALMFVWGA